MTTAIARLDDDAISRIAAGEVVTRPASVVKELVENSVDADARLVEVEVEGGGVDLIRVRDDGRGIPPEEAPLAFERHATSKIRAAGDVEGVETLGFRGEALWAIADAGEVELATRAESETAVRVTPDGEPAPVGRAVGTTVEVRDLFADRPARRESLASPRREFARISDLVGEHALNRPDVRFRLDHDGDRVFATPGSGNRVDAALGVYDRGVAGRAFEFAGRDGEATVEGLLVAPSVTRASPDHVYTAVDGRPVRESALRDGVVGGYGSLLPADRYPIAAVDVSLPPERVDVNVHPAKTEVALSDPESVRRSVEDAVGDALAGEDLVRSAEAAIDVEESLEPLDGDSRFEELSVIGVFRDLYVLCESESNGRLLVIDGHAANERVNYERLRAAVRGEDGDGNRNGNGNRDGNGLPSRSVAPPETVSLGPATAPLVDDDEVRAAVERLGFSVESLGGGGCRVRAVPAPLGRVTDPGAVRAVLDALRTGDDPRTAVEGDALAELACHPSLRAGDDFDDEVARTLVDRLGACEHPYACPHGRPTVLSIDEATLVRGFDRPNTRLD